MPNGDRLRCKAESDLHEISEIEIKNIKSISGSKQIIFLGQERDTVEDRKKERGWKSILHKGSSIRKDSSRTMIGMTPECRDMHSELVFWSLDFIWKTVATFSLLQLTLVLLIVVAILMHYLRMLYESRRMLVVRVVKKSGKAHITAQVKQPPSPWPLPIIGNLANLVRFQAPFQGFTELSKQFGAIYGLQLGSTKCVVVNSLDAIRQILHKKGSFFGGRPDFLRYHSLFAGDRNNCKLVNTFFTSISSKDFLFSRNS